MKRGGRAGMSVWVKRAGAVCGAQRSGTMTKSRIPDRWQDYSAVGQRLLGTRFIAFKVPLKKIFGNCLLPNEVFTPIDLLKQVGEQNEELGMIIDLTFTKRYYDSMELPEGLNYEKIFTAGHEIPSAKSILSFKRTVKTFLLENMDNDKLIGVHCTHGVNRTGYLICRYLIDVDGMEPCAAIDLFSKSRGYPIERQNYIQDLLQGPHRSNKGIDVLVPCLVTKQMGQMGTQQRVSTPRDRAKQAKHPARNDFREFSHFVCPSRQSANSYLPMQRSRPQRFGNSAVHQLVHNNGQSAAYSDCAGRWQEPSWRSCQPKSSWRHYQVESPWGKDQVVYSGGYQLQCGMRSTRERKLISRGQVRLNTHLRWDN